MRPWHHAVAALPVPDKSLVRVGASRPITNAIFHAHLQPMSPSANSGHRGLQLVRACIHRREFPFQETKEKSE